MERGTITHNFGGHLDQIFTNIPGLQATMEDTGLSDHKMIRLQVRFMKDKSDVDLDNMPTKIT